jgi:hypothetical protein
MVVVVVVGGSVVVDVDDDVVDEDEEPDFDEVVVVVVGASVVVVVDVDVVVVVVVDFTFEGTGTASDVLVRVTKFGSRNPSRIAFFPSEGMGFAALPGSIVTTPLPSVVYAWTRLVLAGRLRTRPQTSSVSPTSQRFAFVGGTTAFFVDATVVGWVRS